MYIHVPTVPGAPTGLVITPPPDKCDQLNLHWTAPSSTGGLPVKYRVYSNGVLEQRILSSTRAAILGLAINSEYRVRVIAFNDLGDGKEVTGVRRTRPHGI